MGDDTMIIKRPNMSQELIITDGFAPEILGLLQGAKVPAIALSWAEDALQAITIALAGEEIEALHIVAHGCGEGFLSADNGWMKKRYANRLICLNSGGLSALRCGAVRLG